MNFGFLKSQSSDLCSLIKLIGQSSRNEKILNNDRLQIDYLLFLFATQGQSSHLCSTILDVISSIYQQDNANYFILEPHNTLSQFVERIHLKPPNVQVSGYIGEGRGGGVEGRQCQLLYSGTTQYIVTVR